MVRSAVMTAGHSAPPDGPWLTFPLAGHAILTVDATDAVTYCNEGARLLFGIDPDDTPVHTPDLFGPPLGVPGGVRTLLDGFAEAADRPTAWTGNLPCFRGGGQPFVVTATAAGAGQPGVLTVICGPPPAGDAGFPVASWLPPELSRRIGHELRGSLTGIAGLAAIMAKRAGGAERGSGDELRRLRMIELNARTGIATVDRVVELTRIESGRTRCHKVVAPVGPILAAAIGTCAATAGPARCVLAADTPDLLTVPTDPVLVQAIVAELITNALVAGAAGEVCVRALAGPGAILVEVTDDGGGIAPDELSTVFDPFVRGESAADGAVGLGLHLARRRAQLIGARLTVRSSPGHGSTFTLALPDERVEPPGPGSGR
jgi:anti-sigma regulatory factor (Ser/Thr protein kinase)